MDFTLGLITGIYTIIAIIAISVLYVYKVKIDLPGLINGRSQSVEPATTNGQSDVNINNLGDVSHTRLRQLIESIIAETLRTPNLLNGNASSEITLDTRSNGDITLSPLANGKPGKRHRTEHYFEPKIYQDLLATAVLNKIVDTHGNNNGRRMSESTPDLSGQTNRDTNFNVENQSITSGSSVEPRSDSSSDTDQLGNVGRIAERTLNSSQQNLPDDDPNAIGRESALSDYIATHMVPLPDLSAAATESEGDEHASSSSGAMGEGTWEDNWLFKKRKSSLTTTVTGSGVGMLVPAPKELIRAQIGDKAADEVSDLSEMGSETDDSSLDMLRPNSDRIMNKHIIGGQNTKHVLDELLDCASTISATMPVETQQVIAETKNPNVIEQSTAEAINANVTKSPQEEKHGTLSPPKEFKDAKVSETIPLSNPLAAMQTTEEVSESEGCTGFGTVELLDSDPYSPTATRTPSVIEILAAIALGPMLAVPASEQPTDLTPNELTTIKELSDLALAEISARTNELTQSFLGVIEEEIEDSKPVELSSTEINETEKTPEQPKQNDNSSIATPQTVSRESPAVQVATKKQKTTIETNPNAVQIESTVEPVAFKIANPTESNATEPIQIENKPVVKSSDNVTQSAPVTAKPADTEIPGTVYPPETEPKTTIATLEPQKGELTDPPSTATKQPISSQNIEAVVVVSEKIEPATVSAVKVDIEIKEKVSELEKDQKPSATIDPPEQPNSSEASVTVEKISETAEPPKESAAVTEPLNNTKDLSDEASTSETVEPIATPVEVTETITIENAVVATQTPEKVEPSAESANAPNEPAVTEIPNNVNLSETEAQGKQQPPTQASVVGEQQSVVEVPIDMESEPEKKKLPKELLACEELPATSEKSATLEQNNLGTSDLSVMADSVPISQRELISSTDILTDVTVAQAESAGTSAFHKRRLRRQSKVVGDTTPSDEQSEESGNVNLLATMCKVYIKDKQLLAALEKRRRQTLIMHKFLSSFETPEASSPHTNPGDEPIAFRTIPNQTERTEEITNGDSFTLTGYSDYSLNFFNEILFSDQLSSDSNTSTPTIIESYASTNYTENEDVNTFDGYKINEITNTTANFTNTTNNVENNGNRNSMLSFVADIDDKTTADQDMNGNSDDDDVVMLRRFVPGSIAEREYKKWYNAVDMPNNPYAPEALKKRISGSQERFIDIPNISPGTETALLQDAKDVSTPEEIDRDLENTKRYSRDYYVNNGKQAPLQVKSPTGTSAPITDEIEDDIIINEVIPNGRPSSSSSQHSQESNAFHWTLSTPVRRSSSLKFINQNRTSPIHHFNNNNNNRNVTPTTMKQLAPTKLNKLPKRAATSASNYEDDHFNGDNDENDDEFYDDDTADMRSQHSWRSAYSGLHTTTRRRTHSSFSSVHSSASVTSLNSTATGSSTSPKKRSIPNAKILTQFEKQLLHKDLKRNSFRAISATTKDFVVNPLYERDQFFSTNEEGKARLSLKPDINQDDQGDSGVDSCLNGFSEMDAKNSNNSLLF